MKAIWGGAETLLGTNPLAVAIPSGEEAPVVLDIATTVVSYGTVKNYRLQGKEMPEGWMVSMPRRRASDRPGAQRRRPAVADRRLQPRGRRSGLALALGLLAGTLNGGAFGRDVVDFNADDKSAGDTGHFIIRRSTSRASCQLANFTAEVDRHFLRDLRVVATPAGLRCDPLARRGAAAAAGRPCGERGADLAGADGAARSPRD